MWNSCSCDPHTNKQLFYQACRTEVYSMNIYCTVSLKDQPEWLNNDDLQDVNLASQSQYDISSAPCFVH